MKTVLFALALVAVFSFASLAADQPAAPKPKFSLVKIVDREEKETLEIFEPQQLTSLQNDIKLEERLFDKAMILAEKAWKADESTKTKSFPRSAIGRRSCTFVNSYIKREDAEKALAREEERVARAEESKADAEKKREETKQRMGHNNNPYAKKKDTKKADAEKKGMEDQARNLFATKLEELKTKSDAKEKEAAAPAAGDAKAGDAKDAKAGDVKDPKAAGAAGLAGVGGMKK